jgi:hypothetical protein
LKEMSKIYLVKKGPADPFRGDWYTDDRCFASANQAIAHAAALTLADYNDYLTSCEWSVFEKEGDTEMKIWEGYKYIKSSEHQSPDIKLGCIQ